METFDAIWPFMVLVVSLFIGLGYMMSRMERNTVMQNWDKRRCELPIMAAARFFKSDTDPRTPGEFSSDNFDFCMKQFVDQFMELFMAPLTTVMGKQSNVTANTVDMLGQVRRMAQTMYTAFSGYLSQYMTKFHRSIYELNRIMTYLRMGMQRMSAMAMSMIYTGITLFRGMINSIQAVIRVVLIVCSIMLAIIIILFFVLFPVIPVIMSTLTAVVMITVALGAVMSQSIAADAESKKSGFCFAEGTPVQMKDGTTRPIETLRVGDRLADGEDYTPTMVTARMVMSGEGVLFYDYKGVAVSGSHLVHHEGAWKMVEETGVAPIPSRRSARVYCLNTTSNIIPVQSPLSADGSVTVRFRDWEEIDNEDEVAQREWHSLLLRLLNPNTTTAADAATDLPAETPLMSGRIAVYIADGTVRPIRDVRVGDHVEGGGMVLGIVEGVSTIPVNHEVPSPSTPWHSMLYVLQGTEEWVRISSQGAPTSLQDQTGYQLITETGVFRVLLPSASSASSASSFATAAYYVRDFTEIGHDRIHETYDFVSAKLR